MNRTKKRALTVRIVKTAISVALAAVIVVAMVLVNHS